MKILKDKVAVITGAAGGIGSAIAVELARAGMDTVLADVDEKGMHEVANSIAALGRRCTCVVTDVSRFDQIENLLERTLAAHGACHLMVNNAGIIQAADLFGVDLDRWLRVIGVNLNGVLYGSRVFGEYFISQRKGHIVNVSSAAALFPMPGMTMYSTSKFAVHGFTQQLRWELALKGVGVTLVCPGTIKSKMHHGPGVGLPPDYAKLITRFAADPAGFARKIRRAIQSNRPMVRYGADVYFFSLMQLFPMWLKDLIGGQAARIILRMIAPKK